MSDYGRHTDDRQIRAKPYSASMIGISIAVVVLVGALIMLGVLYLFGDDNGDNESDFTIAQSTTPTEYVEPTDSNGAATETPEESDDPTSTPAELTPSPTTSPTLTPSPTDEIDPSPTDEPDTAVPTEEEPTTPPTSEVEEPEPTEEPFTGEFGPLPPAQLPSGGASTSLSLDYQLGMSLEDLPTTATAYQIEWPLLSFDDVAAMAERLALNGEVVEEGVGIYRVTGDRAEIYISPTETIYNSAGFSAEGEMPSDEVAIQESLEWLQLSGFVGPNIDGGRIAGRDDDLGRIVVEFRPAEPAPNLAPTPSARLTVGPGGSILEARVHWPESLVPSDYGLMAPIDLWTTVENGHGFLEADLSDFDTSAGLTGTATIGNFSVAYSLAGSPSDGQYLVPVVMFEGFARIDQTGDEIPVTVSVPAVYAGSGSTG